MANAPSAYELLNFQAQLAAYNAQQQNRQQAQQNKFSSDETRRLFEMMQAQQANQQQFDRYNQQQQGAYGNRELEVLLALLKDAQSQQATARQANESRYNDILEDRVRTSDRLMGNVEQFGKSLAADTDRNWDTTLNNRLAGLSQTGLLGSTVNDSIRMRTEREREDAQRRNQDALLQNRIGVDERTSEGIQGFMERRTDAYPDLGGVTALAAQAGAAGLGRGGRGVIGGFGGAGTLPNFQPASGSAPPFGLPTTVGRSGAPGVSRPPGAFGLPTAVGARGGEFGQRQPAPVGSVGISPPQMYGGEFGQRQPAPPGFYGPSSPYTPFPSSNQSLAGLLNSPMRSGGGPPQLRRPMLPQGMQYDRVGNMVPVPPKRGIQTQGPKTAQLPQEFGRMGSSIGLSPHYIPGGPNGEFIPAVKPFQQEIPLIPGMIPQSGGGSSDINSLLAGLLQQLAGNNNNGGGNNFVGQSAQQSPYPPMPRPRRNVAPPLTIQQRRNFGQAQNAGQGTMNAFWNAFSPLPLQFNPSGVYGG